MKRVLIVSCIVTAIYADLAERPKHIAFAREFNSATPQELLALADEFDKTPLDGVGINLRSSAVVDGVRKLNK